MNKSGQIKNLAIGVGFALLCGFVLYTSLSPWFSGRAEVNTLYGRRSSRGRNSVNGTSVLAEMFRKEGHKVATWRQLSPRLHRSKAIVWAPNSFELPSTKAINFFDNSWLPGQEFDWEERTLIYIARDYDASLEYWQSLAGQSKGEQFIETRRRLARAQSDHAYGRSLTANEAKCNWFSIESHQHFTEVTPSDGPWADDIDTEQARITVAGELKLPDNVRIKSEVLLADDQSKPLIVRLTNEYDWQESQVILVLNGSSLLNLPLVNHENRKLAAKLIAECGQPGKVTFLESGPSGLVVSNSDPRSHSGFTALRVWPLSSILMHLIVAGILFCMMVFPIFGRPREIRDNSVSDFGKHVRAMGELLAMTNDRESAVARVNQYRSLNLESGRKDKQANERSPAADAAGAGNPFGGNPFKV